MSEENIPTEQPQAGQAPRLPASHVDPGRSGDHQGSPAQGSAPAVGVVWRIERRNIFEALRRGRRRRDGPITISWVAGDPAEPPRVAYTIGRRVGTAVVRNQLRRRLRMLIREAAPQLRPGAYLVGVAPPAANLTYAQLEAHVYKALKEVQK
jgi:ribonuclease P protein component